MTATSPLAPASVEAIHIPYIIERRTAELYFQLLVALLAHQGHCVTLDGIEPDGVGGWHIHFACDKATIDLLRDVAMKIADRRNPLWLLARVSVCTKHMSGVRLSRSPTEQCCAGTVRDAILAIWTSCTHTLRRPIA